MKWKKVLLAVIIIVLIFAVSGWLYFKYKKQQDGAQQKLTPEQQKVQDQLNQLEALRQQYNLQPPTPEQMKNQLNQLEQLRQKHSTSTSVSGTMVPKPLTQQQIKQQLDELQKLRNQ